MSKSIKLLLTENVDNLGIVGDVVSVRTGYARNFLLPRSLARKPTDKAIAALAARRAEVERQLAELRRQLEGVVGKLKGFEVTIERSCNDNGWLYGSVTQREIADALHKAGFPQVQDRHIRIGTAIKRIDTYDIPIQFDSDLKTEVKLWVVADRPLNLPKEGDVGVEGEGAPEGESAAAESAPAEGGKPARKGKGKKAKDGETAESAEMPATEKAAVAAKPEKAEKSEKSEGKKTKKAPKGE